MTKSQAGWLWAALSAVSMAALFFAVTHQLISNVNFVSGILLWFMVVLISLLYIDKYGSMYLREDSQSVGK